MMNYLVLGPFEARAAGEPVALPGGKPRALLALLLLNAERVVATDALIEGLWHRPPPSAPKVLQAHVSQLRKTLGAEAIDTSPGGYRLTHTESDIARFEDIAETARTTADLAQRARLYRDALSLWRGPALAEFRREPFAAAAGRRLAELRLEILTRRIETELTLGEHERLVPELQTLVEAEPLREHLRAQLMIALYRCGRQADALACYREGRQILVDRLGIEPGAELQDLERRILRHDLADRQQPTVRGAIVCTDGVPLELVAPLARDGRELLLVDLVDDAAAIADRTAALEQLRVSLDPPIRIACFTSTDRHADIARLAAEQQAELAVVSARYDGLLDPPCDVVVIPTVCRFRAEGSILVPFGGRREEWSAIELGAWLARSHGLPLRLLGVHAQDGQRDASRTLASASLALQRFTATAVETALVAPGVDGILSQPGAAIVLSRRDGDLDPTRQSLIRRATVPVLLVRAGLKPGGIAPEHTLTQFSWSLSEP